MSLVEVVTFSHNTVANRVNTSLPPLQCTIHSQVRHLIELLNTVRIQFPHLSLRTR